jgi:hypothetical protein
MENYKNHIAGCFELIEEKLSRGACNTWDTNDFMALSESIKETTGTLLSVTTLKRLSGHVDYNSRPNNTTLNALAGYVGFKNWSAFLKDRNMSEGDNIIESKKSSSNKYLVPVLLIVSAFLSSVFLYYDSRGTSYTSKDFSFNGKSVTTGLPNSVVFEYNALAANENAKIEIQQDWDERKRVTVDKEDSVSTSIYYRPGFFKSKLVVDNTIVAEKKIFIPTQGWLGVIESDSIPIYLNDEDFTNTMENSLQITPESLAQYGVDPTTGMTAVGFYQVMDFGNLFTDEFEMSTLLRNEFRSGASVCQRAQVIVMHEDGPISLIISDKGCISEIGLFAFGQQIDGKKTDLSNFGVNFSNYVELKCISENKKLKIFLDAKLVYSFDVPETPSKIIGISIFFEGAGSVKSVEFKKNQKVVYDFGL